MRAMPVTLQPLLLLSLSLLGCQASSGFAPALPPDPLSENGLAAIPGALYSPVAPYGGIAQHEGSTEGVIGLARLSIDPLNMTASVEALEPRRAQETDDQYELSVNIHFNPADIEITDLTGTATTLDVEYKISHPFAPPSDLSAEPSSTNRSDLGVAGRVLLLVDTPTAVGNSYFVGTDDTVLNTKLIVNAAGYYKPYDLIDTTGFIANAFPFQPLVDEILDPRTNTATTAPIGNGLNPLGNYFEPDPLGGGWQQANYGLELVSWTGFGILHQGQSATNMFSFAKSELVTPVSFQLAILAKYTDPRGGIDSTERRANRLPGTTFDITKFIYREPHGALDVERVNFYEEAGNFEPNVISANYLRFQLVDWDARAAQTGAANLGLDSSYQTVPAGAQGIPQLELCIPGVLGDATYSWALSPIDLEDDDSLWAGDAGVDSGRPGDPIFFNAFVTKNAGIGQSEGEFTGVIRATDPEDALDRSSWFFPKDGSVFPPVDLLPTDTPPRPVIYQVFKVMQETP